jgi:hypothetical protein
MSVNDTDNDIPLAEDAIPREAIGLTSAYGCVVSFLRDHPEFLPDFDEDWREALNKSRKVERDVGHDPEMFDDELEAEWHRRKEANLLLRLAVSYPCTARRSRYSSL